jgi:excisionase family DNA binding protein
MKTLAECPDVLSVEQAAEYLQCGTPAVYDLCRTPDFPAKLVGGKWRIFKDGLRRWFVGDSETERAAKLAAQQLLALLQDWLAGGASSSGDSVSRISSLVSERGK